MELTRRDAIAALAAIGIGGGAVYAAGEFDDDTPGEGATTDSTDRSTDEGSTDEEMNTLVTTAVALADVVYPPEVSEQAAFVRTYVRGRVDGDDAHRAGMTDAVAALDAHAREEHDVPFRELDAEQGDALLEDLGMDRTDPDPEGSERERIRYYLVNELLYALMSSPKGGELVGIENPPGHPGGLDAYQQGPQGG